MLSDLSFSTLPFDIPALADTRPFCSEEDSLAPLNFDDLLDIAREFEFAHTITHVWPCEEPSTCAETRFDDIFAAIVPGTNVEECPLPLPSPAPMTVNPDCMQQIDLMDHTFDPNACISIDPMSLPKNEGQVRAAIGLSIAATLQGWSPPNGAQFLELDESLLLPQLAEGARHSPRQEVPLAALPILPVTDANGSFATDPATGKGQPQTSAIVSKHPPGSTVHKAADDPRKKSVPTPAQLSTRSILEPVQDQSVAQTSSSAPSRAVTLPHVKAPKSRPHLPSAPRTGGAAPAASYARAPRGGIPPHIARSVTKANVLRVEKERKVMHDAFCSTATREAKKPSVLRRAVKVERETSKNINSCGSGKKPRVLEENDENEQRAAKRVRV